MTRRILHVIADAQVGGAQVYLTELVREQRGRGYRTIIATGGEGPLVGLYRDVADRFVHMPSLRRAVGFRDALAVAQIARLARGCDIVHAHASKALLAAVLARPLHRLPVVWSAHGYDSAHADFGPRAKFVLDRVKGSLARGCSTITVASRNVAERVRATGIVETRIRVVYTGVRTERFLAVPPPPPDTFVVGAAGRFVPLKGFSVLLEALGSLHADGRGVGAVLYGYGPEEKRLREKISQLNLGGQVRIRPPASDMAKAFAEMNVVVVPSLVDSFPLVPCEAMVAGRPVIASSVGGLPDAFESGRHGYHVSPGDTHALAEAIASLAADPIRARAMGAEARRYASERYRWDRVADEYAELYDSVLR